jgi:hypothetical protein
MLFTGDDKCVYVSMSFNVFFSLYFFEQTVLGSVTRRGLEFKGMTAGELFNVWKYARSSVFVMIIFQNDEGKTDNDWMVINQPKC